MNHLNLELINLIEQGGIGLAFSILLFFILQQFRRMVDQLIYMHTALVEVCERNSSGMAEMRHSIDCLSDRLRDRKRVTLCEK